MATASRKPNRKPTIPAELQEMTIEELRDEFRKLRRNATQFMGREAFDDQINALTRKNATPEEFVYAAEKVTCSCERCRGTGRYSWGACVNGKMEHTGDCYACQGKGRLNQDDFRRNWGYWRYAIVQALR
jgi:late competence protein required for DNA uptake (superfamily II DNA/RNA helicase)